MEINATFETYIILDDEEFKVEVNTVGDLMDDGVENVFVTSIYNLETDELVTFSLLSKEQRKELLASAEEELNEREMMEVYGEQ